MLPVLAVLNGKEGRTLRVPLSFLGKGRYHATLVRDDRVNGAAVQVEQRDVAARDAVDLSLRDGGGFVARFVARAGMDPARAHRAGGTLRSPPTPR